MKLKTIVVELLSLSADKLNNCHLKRRAEFRWLECFATPLVSASSAQFEQAFGTQHLVMLWSFRKPNQALPGHNGPGFFMACSWSSTLAMTLPKLERRKPVENDTLHFHDSESGDIYDLFNACNGIVREGFLDVRQLDNYTAEEAKELNITRLGEIWKHTKTGCSHCQKVVAALSGLRDKLAYIADDIRSHDGPDLDSDPDINHINSIY